MAKTKEMVTIAEPEVLGKISRRPLGAAYGWGSAPVQGAIGAATARIALPEGSEVVEIRASSDCYIKFGAADVTAASDGNSDLFVRGVQAVVVRRQTNGLPYSHLAFIQLSEAGVIQVVKL